MGVFTRWFGRGRGVQWVGDAGRLLGGGEAEEEERGEGGEGGLEEEGGSPVRRRPQVSRPEEVPTSPALPSLCLPYSLQCYEALAEALQDCPLPFFPSPPPVSHA